MDDSGSSRFPTKPPAPGSGGLPPARNEIGARIIEVSGSLSRLSKPISIEGEITEVRHDGNVKITTEQGDITIRPKEPVRLQPGQTIEVNLPAGSPPRQAILRPLPNQPPAEFPPAQQGSPSPDRPAPARPTLDQATQANLNEQQTLRPPAPANLRPSAPVPQPLPPDAIVRLTPLPPDQTRQLAEQIIQTIQARTLSAISFATQAIQMTLPREQAASWISIPRPPSVQNSAPLPVTSFLPPDAPSSTFLGAPQPGIKSFMIPEPRTLSLLPFPGKNIESPTISLSPTPSRTAALFDARIQTIIPPDSRMKVTNPLLQPGSAITNTAQVVTISTQNLPVVAVTLPGIADPQMFLINFPASNLIPGASLVLLPQANLAPAPAAMAGPPSAFELMSGFRWPVFDDLLDIQVQSLQSTTTQALSGILPNPVQPGRIPAAVLLFIAAVRSGDIQSWLGEKNIDTLRRTGRSESINRMAREFTGLNKLASEPVTTEWRGMAIPMMGQGDIQKIHLYYRYTESDGQKERAGKGKGTRFIMDFQLSALGDVQLDGYVRGKIMDLAVRTQKPLGARMRRDMTRRYIQALEKAHLEGALIFQAQPEKWIKVTLRPDILSASV